MKIKSLLNPGWSGSCRALIGQLQCVQYEQFYLKNIIKEIDIYVS